MQGLQGAPVRLLQPFEGRRAALLHGTDPVRVPHRRQQVVPHLLAQEGQVVLALHLVAHHPQGDVVVLGVLLVLAVDGDALAGRLGHQEGHVEAGEHPGRERVAARRHVDDDILVPPVHQVVQVELHRADLGVVAGDAEIGLVERAGGHQAHRAVVQADGPGAGGVHRVVLGDPQQARPPARRRRLDHGLRGGDPRIGAAQVLLDRRKVRTHGRQRRGLRLLQAERGAEMLVDVRVHGDHGQADGGQVTDEQRGQRGLATAALADECDLHVHLA